MISTDAWVLRAGPVGTAQQEATLTRETLSLREPADHEALVEPLTGSWEANMDHALARSPVDICRQRGESAVIIGNSGLVRVLRPARSAPSPPQGTVCMLLPFGVRDPHGYVVRVHGYDAPGSYGLLARRIPLSAELLLPLPTDTPFPPERWAPALRYFTAWDNWHVAHRCWRAQMGDDDPAGHLVFGWGGGVALAALELARRAGFRTAMTAGTDARVALLRARGISPVDRRDYPHLAYHAASDRDRDGQRESEHAFLEKIAQLSDGRGVSILLDNIGGPLHEVTMRALARQGVITTCGWKAGMNLPVVRATECQSRHLHVHTHGWRFEESPAIRDYQERTGWIADVAHQHIHDFDDVPQLAREYAQGRVDDYYPLYQVNPL
ncbi:zinc-binding alcohol dehydrogenase family protein [Streptomyces sp. NPDC088789]|uniref:zinc-binding alcohol dehydrogenase family protein n=1 Tax=Streptomyces sp. NPDC088789 TaxID=3365899 RepID=UPI00382C8A60